MNRILLAIWPSLCLLLYACSIGQVYQEYSIEDLGKPIVDTLKAGQVDQVIGVEISLVGEVDGEALLEIENGNGRFSRMELKGKINQTYETEWYSKNMLVKYTPVSTIQGGSLKLRYRMY